VVLTNGVGATTLTPFITSLLKDNDFGQPSMRKRL